MFFCDIQVVNCCGRNTTALAVDSHLSFGELNAEWFHNSWWLTWTHNSTNRKGQRMPFFLHQRRLELTPAEAAVLVHPLCPAREDLIMAAYPPGHKIWFRSCQGRFLFQSWSKHSEPTAHVGGSNMAAAMPTLTCAVCWETKQIECFARRKRDKEKAQCAGCVLRWGHDFSTARTNHHLFHTFWRYWRVWHSDPRVLRVDDAMEVLWATRRD
jgi:hypothetical protein